MGFSLIQLVIGFGLIVFVHELGHFLAAKYVGIRVEQFALGFGPAVFSWRKGMGFRRGSGEKEYERITKSETPDANKVDAATLGDTEYRVNWVPLGGYVKMLGQDDTKPGVVVDNPRSYTSKSISARMLVISAGVFMNILFAGIAFMILFMTGLKVPEAVVGSVVPMAPAQFAMRADGSAAPLQVGDKLLSIDGTPLYNDFRKIALNIALAKKGETLNVEVQRTSGKVEMLKITPRAMGQGSMQLLGIGIGLPALLQGPDLADAEARKAFDRIPADRRPAGGGEKITRVAGQDVKVDEYYKLDAALQQSDGQPVPVTVTAADGKTRSAMVKPILATPAMVEGIAPAGMQPRPVIVGIDERSSSFGKLKDDDIVIAISSNGDTLNYPSVNSLMQWIRSAGEAGSKMTLTVLRGDKEVTVADVVANLRIDKSTKGLGIGIGVDQDHAVLSQAVKGSTAAALPAGSTILAVDGTGVKTWSDVIKDLRKVEAGKTVVITASQSMDKASSAYAIELRPADVQYLANMRYTADIVLKDMRDARKTTNPLLAAWWGVDETRDSIRQVYVTLKRLIEGSVPLSGMAGPLGMAQMGVRVASQGLDYLLWFLAIISANLAVVNFLPIPVVDGGHFLFLIIEKIQGKPISEKTMAVAQYIGLGLILAVFVLVTYQDVLRWMTIN